MRMSLSRPIVALAWLGSSFSVAQPCSFPNGGRGVPNWKAKFPPGADPNACLTPHVLAQYVMCFCSRSRREESVGSGSPRRRIPAVTSLGERGCQLHGTDVTARDAPLTKHPHLQTRRANEKTCSKHQHWNCATTPSQTTTHHTLNVYEVILVGKPRVKSLSKHTQHSIYRHSKSDTGDMFWEHVVTNAQGLKIGKSYSRSPTGLALGHDVRRC